MAEKIRPSNFPTRRDWPVADDYFGADSPTLGTAGVPGAALHRLAESIAKQFTTIDSYSARELVTHLGELYRFKVDHPAGAWNAAHVDHVDLSDFGLEGFSVVDNNRYLFAHCDSNGVVLFGVKPDGSFTWAKGIPEPLRELVEAIANKVDKVTGKTLIDELVAGSLKIVTNEMYSFAVTDSADRVLFGVDTKGRPLIDEFVRELIGDFFNKRTDSPYMFCMLDESGKVLFSIGKDGRSSIDDQVQRDVYEYFTKTSPRYALAFVDSENNIIFGIDSNNALHSTAVEAAIKKSLEEYEPMDYGYVDSKVNAEKTRAEGAEAEMREAIDNINPTTVVGGENNPDEEFLTSIDDKVTLKDRAVVYNDYRRVYVRKDDDFAQKVTDSRCEYFICFSHNLAGARVEIPANSVLHFDGGCIYNGTLVGNDTGLISETDSVFGPSLAITGSWNAPVIKTSFLMDSASDNAVKTLIPLLSDDVFNEFVVNTDIFFHPQVDYDSYIKIGSKTRLVILKSITVRQNDYPHYYAVSSDISSDIEICGGGELVGDADTHDYSTVQSTHEWCHGIMLEQVTNAHIHDLLIHSFPGDGVACDGHGSNRSENIIFERATIRHCGRQGLSLCGVHNVMVRNCTMTDIYRTAPKAAIDIEPWQGELAENITIENVTATDSMGFDVCYCKNVAFANVKTIHSKLFLFKDCEQVEVNNARCESVSNGTEVIQSEGAVSTVRLSNVVVDTTNLIYLELRGVFIDATSSFGPSAVTQSGPAEGSFKFENSVLSYFDGANWNNL